MKKPCYLFVVGGVMSGVGKGTAVAALGQTLKARGFTITALKIDPYVNVDAGTMNPLEHGEVFVTKDGDETDQDIGTYERFLGLEITKINYMTTGRVYQAVIDRERALGYGGKCVEVVPHVPEEVIRRIEAATKLAKAEIAIIEIGGTVGEYQNILFLEAARMMQVRHRGRVKIILVSYLPVPGSIGEMKTKPTQTAVRTLNATGLSPDFVVARGPVSIDKPRQQKIADFCQVPWDHIIAAPDVKSIYDVPELFEKQNFSKKVLTSLKLPLRPLAKPLWRSYLKQKAAASGTVVVGVVGKYFSTGDFILSDVYLSVIEAIKHAAVANGVGLELRWLNPEAYEKSSSAINELKAVDALIVPGGFGSRGVEGKLKAIRFARENKLPFLGLCYGMQAAVIEFSRNVARLKFANTTEIMPNTPQPVIDLIAGQHSNLQNGRLGGTLRLGEYPCELSPNSLAAKLYGTSKIKERHRHRYEFNVDYADKLQGVGMVLSGTSPDGKLVEIIELPEHPFFIGVQFHPEFLSKPLAPHPLFNGLITAAKKTSQSR